MLKRKFVWLLVASFVIAGLCGCQKKSRGQVKEHEPLSESEYLLTQNLDLPTDGPIVHKLIYRNDINHYTLAALAGRELHAEIAAKGPSSICKSNCSWAYVWTFLWKWDTRKRGGACSINWINTKLYIDYHVPLWVRESQAAPNFQLRYAAWMREGWSYLNTRIAIIIQESALLERTVMMLPEQDCEALDRRVKSEGVLAQARIDTRIAALSKEAAMASRDWMLDF